jgi:hypothetical protein
MEIKQLDLVAAGRSRMPCEFARERKIVQATIPLFAIELTSRVFPLANRNTKGKGVQREKHRTSSQTIKEQTQ